jgi:hypothetical protein
MESSERIPHVEYIVYVHAVSLTLHICKTDKDYHCYPISDLLREVMAFVTVGMYEHKCTKCSTVGPVDNYYQTVVFMCVSIILFPC